MSGIPGMMGTPVTQAAPAKSGTPAVPSGGPAASGTVPGGPRPAGVGFERVGSHPATPAHTAISTEARSSDIDGNVDSVAPHDSAPHATAPHHSAVRGDRSGGTAIGAHGSGLDSSGYGLDDAAPRQSSNADSGLLDGFVGGVLN
jgi:hypothetical protein